MPNAQPATIPLSLIAIIMLAGCASSTLSPASVSHAQAADPLAPIIMSGNFSFAPAAVCTPYPGAPNGGCVGFTVDDVAHIQSAVNSNAKIVFTWEPVNPTMRELRFFLTHATHDSTPPSAAGASPLTLDTRVESETCGCQIGIEAASVPTVMIVLPEQYQVVSWTATLTPTNATAAP